MDLQKLLIDVCRRAELKKIPKLIECKGTSAQARLNKIRIGRKLKSYLTKREMKGVIAHEVHHVKKLIQYTIVTVAAEILLFIAVVAVELIGFLTLAREFPMLIAHIPLTAFLAIVVISAGISCLLLLRFESKRRELQADRFAASIVGPRLFAEALKKIHSIPSKPRLRSKIWEWLHPHPPLNRRLQAIQDVRKTLVT